MEDVRSPCPMLSLARSQWLPCRLCNKQGHCIASCPAYRATLVPLDLKPMQSQPSSADFPFLSESEQSRGKVGAAARRPAAAVPQNGKVSPSAAPASSTDRARPAVGVARSSGNPSAKRQLSFIGAARKPPSVVSPAAAAAVKSSTTVAAKHAAAAPPAVPAASRTSAADTEQLLTRLVDAAIRRLEERLMRTLRDQLATLSARVDDLTAAQDARDGFDPEDYAMEEEELEQEDGGSGIGHSGCANLVTAA